MEQKLLYLELLSDMPGADARRRVAVERCKPCTNPHDTDDMPRFLPAGLTPYDLSNHSIKSPPYHVTGDDVIPAQRMDVDKITGHQCVRGRGGVVAVKYERDWKDLLRPSWEREMDLNNWRTKILLYWLGTPDQRRQTNRLYRKMRIGAAVRELASMNGERYASPSYDLVTHSVYSERLTNKVLPICAYIWYKAQDALRWLGKVFKRTSTPHVFFVRFLGNPGPIKIHLSPKLSATAIAVRGSCYTCNFIGAEFVQSWYFAQCRRVSRRRYNNHIVTTFSPRIFYTTVVLRAFHRWKYAV